jgi:DNA-binding HxlR family transcriptional regulator
MLILRDALLGSRRYEQFKSSLAVADNVLSRRLQAMVDAGLLRRVPYRAEKRTHHEYHLTEAGADLLPVVQALLLWGEKHTRSPLGDVHLTIVHTRCGHTSSTADTCSHCGTVLRAEEVAWRRPWRMPELTALVGGD